MLSLFVYPDIYHKYHAQRRKKPASIKEDTRQWNTYLKDQIGNRKAADIRRRDVFHLLDDIAGRGPVQANRVLTLLSTIFNVAMAIALPVCGRVFDRYTPHRYSSIIFFIFSLFPVCLFFVQFFSGIYRDIMLYVAFSIYGIGMGGITVTWNFSSIRFAGKKQDAGLFQSVHIAATGIRGLVAPLTGWVT